jgi:arsenate reductase (thioredoxin)
LNKKILVLCTGNSCRSIIAEAIINAHVKDVKAYSAGVRASGVVNPNAKAVLQKDDIWRDEYHSKTIKEIEDIDFDLVITVCDNAKESCPIFEKKAKVIHVGFEDPDGKEYAEFVKTFDEIKTKLIPIVENEL